MNTTTTTEPHNFRRLVLHTFSALDAQSASKEYDVTNWAPAEVNGLITLTEKTSRCWHFSFPVNLIK